MSKPHVAVLMGGMSAEHDVSMSSGAQVAASLDRDRYDVTPVAIAKTGEWSFPDARPLPIVEAIAELARRRVDCVFIALHGSFGEDGRLQGMLDLLGIPYTSSGCAASAIAMDKLRSKWIAEQAGIRVAAHAVVARDEWVRDPDSAVARIAATAGYPCVVKPQCQGSSVGMAIPQDEAALRAAMPAALELDDAALVEQYVKGIEVTCGVLDAEPSGPRALPVTEIRPVAAAFFDYTAKYTPGASVEITPAEIPADMAAKVQAIALRAHAAIGCGIWSRSDMIIDGQGPVWIEINTIPGMTPTSLFPQAAAAVGIPFARLMGMFIDAAIARRAKQ